METLVAIGLVGNIIQFVSFSGELISKSVEIYHSGSGTFKDNASIETATNHLIFLNREIQDSSTSIGDERLQRLCASCSAAAEDLLAALDKVKVKGQPSKWKSIRKALQSVWSKEDIEKLEQRLATLRDDLNLHIDMDMRCACPTTHWPS